MSLSILKIKPSTTNSTITSYDKPHTVVYLSRNNYTNVEKKLLIWMPGTFGQPSNQMKIQKYAAIEQGYFVVGIQYVNGETVGNLCKKQPQSCYYNTRVEVITGQDLSSVISVSPTNCILNRVTSLLNYLSNNVDPVWGEFLQSSSQIDWSKTSVAGHSQGGGNAAVMAQLYPLQIAALFSAPADSSDWTSSYSFATPPTQVYGLIHYADPGCEDALSNWKGEGLTGPFFDFLKAEKSNGFGGSHTLCSSTYLSVFDCLSAHGSTAVDSRLALQSNGDPVVQPAWAYMLSGEQSSIPTGNMSTCSCNPCLVTMFVVIAACLFSFLFPPAILTFLVYRNGKVNSFCRLFMPLGVAWLVYASIAVGIVTAAIVSSSASGLSIADAIGISGGIAGVVTLSLMWWWKDVRWWSCCAQQQQSNGNNAIPETPTSGNYHAVGDESSTRGPFTPQQEDDM